MNDSRSNATFEQTSPTHDAPNLSHLFFNMHGSISFDESSDYLLIEREVVELHALVELTDDFLGLAGRRPVLAVEEDVV